MIAVPGLRVVLPLAAAAVLAACSGPAGSAGTSAVACPQVIAATDLVYPASGSSGIPDAIGQVVVSGPASTVALTPSGGAAVTSSTQVAVPTPLPSPNTQPVNWQTAFAFPTLAAGTTYTVSITNADVAPGCPGAGPTDLGTFTTK
ncbi:MAG TPA: hypothetical protein VMD91_05695 [Candidatus Sulfotelmatobacter sp.]|nr:hypothetical protein [Candidatus Sulfotelmatobacter sp.]